MRQSDPAELASWFDSCGAQLLLYARQWLDAQSAEDVVQDVFLRLMSQRRRPENVKAWLFRSVRNAAASQLRSRSRRRRLHERVAADKPAWFESQPGDLIDAAAVQQAMLSLPEAQRETVVLRIWGQMSLREIADLTGQPVSTVFSRYRAALAAIRERMQMPCKRTKD